MSDTGSDPGLPRPKDPAQMALSYKNMRLAIGLIAIAFPAVMIAHSLAAGKPLEPSISAYAHTPMNEVFVGMLWAMAMFLFSYKGYEAKDDIAGDIAGFAAIVTALWKTSTDANPTSMLSHLLHGGAATIFFIVIAYFALVLFRKGSNRFRNNIYLSCGVVILIAILGLGSISLWGHFVAALKPFFWLEAIAVWAFSVAWLVKGLPDSGKTTP